MTAAYAIKYKNYRTLAAAAAGLYSGLFLLLSGGEEMTAAPLLKVQDKAEIGLEAERLLLEYGNSLLRLAYSYLHNMSDSEDVLQDTLITFIRTAPTFASKSHEKAWAMRVAINLSKNKLQYNKMRCADELSENLASAENEDLSFVWAAVKELPEKYREVIHLFYHEGYQTAEIAEILQKNEATVRSLLHRGKARLRESLREVYDFEE